MVWLVVVLIVSVTADTTFALFQTQLIPYYVRIWNSSGIVSDTADSCFLKYLQEFETEFEKSVCHVSGIHLGSIQRPKILCYYSFHDVAYSKY